MSDKCLIDHRAVAKERMRIMLLEKDKEELVDLLLDAVEKIPSGLVVTEPIDPEDVRALKIALDQLSGPIVMSCDMGEAGEDQSVKYLVIGNGYIDKAMELCEKQINELKVPEELHEPELIKKMHDPILDRRKPEHPNLYSKKGGKHGKH